MGAGSRPPLPRHPLAEQFVESRLQSAMGKALGDRGAAPQITEFDLHTLYTR